MYKYYKDLLTIGITAFNEEKHLKQTLESCVDQAGKIIICDNASTDNTQTICEEFASKYSNIIYVRLDKDYGRDYGYNVPLDMAGTKYFMWCGPHDLIEPDYTLNMIHNLEHSDAVGCFPCSRSITPDGENIGAYNYWYAQDLISDSATKRVYSLIRNLHEMGCIFGIYRTDVLKKYPMPSGAGGDHPVLCNIAKTGKILFCPQSVFVFRNTLLGKTTKEINKWRASTPRTVPDDGSYKFMQQEQLKILKSCKSRSPSDWITKINLIRKAKKKLKKRFGE